MPGARLTVTLLTPASKQTITGYTRHVSPPPSILDNRQCRPLFITTIIHHTPHTMQSSTNQAGPSRQRRPKRPFAAAEHRPSYPDGIFRVVIISSGSVASVKIPDIVGALAKDAGIQVQVVATKASLHFYSQESVDIAFNAAWSSPGRVDQSMDQDFGVRVWKDEDEWSDWKKVGEPILHIELRRWADLVVVAPCSADMLAKIAGGLCDNLATSLLRALTQDTLTILFPAMNTHMYQHPLTADHLAVAQEKLGYMVSGPQGAGRLACGDEGPGKMTDWRDIVSTIQDFAATFRQRTADAAVKAQAEAMRGKAAHSAPKPPAPETKTNPDPSLHPPWQPGFDKYLDLPPISTGRVLSYEPGPSNVDMKETDKLVKSWTAAYKGSEANQSMAHWNSVSNSAGGDGSFWQHRWWIG